MKKFRFAFITLFTVLCIADTAMPQNNVWIYIKDYQGVGVYWRYRQELKDQFISELKFENRNGYKVEVSVSPQFTCEDGTVTNESSQMFNIKSNGTQGGQWAGLFYYPCGGKRPPRSGGYSRLTVKQVN